MGLLADEFKYLRPHKSPIPEEVFGCIGAAIEIICSNFGIGRIFMGQMIAQVTNIGPNVRTGQKLFFLKPVQDINSTSFIST